MKRALSLILAAACAVSFTSCTGPDAAAKNARLAAIGDLAIGYAEAAGKIKPEDAALARQAGKILLTPVPEPKSIESTTPTPAPSGKESKPVVPEYEPFTFTDPRPPGLLQIIADTYFPPIVPPPDLMLAAR